MIKAITSAQNPMIRNVLLLYEKPRARKDQNRIVIEGAREIRLATAGGFTITDLFYTPGLVDEAELNAMASSHRNIRLVEVSPEVFSRIAYRDESGGMIALAEPRRPALSDLHLPVAPLLLILETVEKPGNLGALLRTADAAGLDGVILCDPQTDIYNPNAIRSSLGCIFTLPVVTAGSEETIKWLRASGVKIFGTALTATQFYHETDFTQPAAIVMGSEAFGLSDAWLKGSDALVKIPMAGKVDSMNVSASAAVVVFEALRQRGFQRT
jgi:TrmH family RNA methyltransferase